MEILGGGFGVLSQQEQILILGLRKAKEEVKREVIASTLAILEVHKEKQLHRIVLIK